MSTIPEVGQSDLAGKRTLVIGASRGIGRAIAVGLANAGAAVVGVARSRDALENLGGEVRNRGGDFLTLDEDISIVGGIDAWVDKAWSWRGGIDGVVNAAGVTNRSTALDIASGEWDHVFAVNVRGAFFLMQAVGRRMLDADGGSIVNVASLSGVVSDGAQAAYSASKAAMIQMTRVLADQWAPTVRLNCLSPGWVETDMTRAYLADEVNLSNIVARTPMDRVAFPSEMVGPALFLVSDMSSFMTGQNIVVDGGWSV